MATINIKKSEGTEIGVEATVYGQLAVHPMYNMHGQSKRWWTVTHVLSGQVVQHVQTKRTATLIATELEKNGFDFDAWFNSGCPQTFEGKESAKAIVNCITLYGRMLPTWE